MPHRSRSTNRRVLVADVSNLELLLRKYSFEVVDEAADRMVEAMKADVPVRTGELRDSIHRGPVVETGGGCNVQIEADADQALWVDGGTRPHDIIATQDHGMLVFEVDGGITIFLGDDNNPGEVWHPGTAPNPFFSERMPNRWPILLQEVADQTQTTV